MRKTLTKFVISAVKNEQQFENRIVDVFATNLSGEDALEVLAFGRPIEIKDVDYSKVLDVVRKTQSSSASKITDVKLLTNTHVMVTYERIVNRYFETEEAAQKAKENGSYCSGYGNKTESHPFEAKIVDRDNRVEIPASDMEEALTIIRQG